MTLVRRRQTQVGQPCLVAEAPHVCASALDLQRKTLQHLNMSKLYYKFLRNVLT